MNIKILVGAVVVAALGFGGYYIDKSRAANQAQLSGFFEIQPTQVSSRVGGRVAEILVHEGQTVKKGQVLLRLQAAPNEALLSAQKFAQKQAEAQLLETTRGSRIEDIQKQEAVVRQLQAAYDRVKNGPLPEEISSARDHLKQLTAEYQKMLAGSRPEEIASARAAAAVALQKLRAAERGPTVEEKAELKARLDGAMSSEALARKNFERDSSLYKAGAISRQQFDVSSTTFERASANRRDAEEAYKRAMKGTPQAELEQARENYREAKAQSDLVQRGNRPEDIESAREVMLQARENYLLELKGSRKEDIRAAKAQLDEAQVQLAELVKGNRPEEIAKARGAAEQAAAETKSLTETVQERIVYSPTDGVVDMVLVAVGDLVAPGSVVIQTSNPSDIWVRVYVPELDLSKIKVGDTAEFQFDGMSETLPGVVESIASKGEFTPGNLQSPDERAKQVFAIRLRLAQPDPRVKAGMYVTVKQIGRWH